MCVGVFPTGKSVQHMCAWCLWMSEEDVKSGTRVTEGCELPRVLATDHASPSRANSALNN